MDSGLYHVFGRPKDDGRGSCGVPEWRTEPDAAPATLQMQPVDRPVTSD